MNRFNKTYLFFLLSACIFGLYRYYASATLFENVSSSIMYPLLVAQNKFLTPFKSYFERKKTIAELEQALQKMQAERDNFLAQYITVQSLLNFVEQTKELILYKQQFNMDNALIAKVLVKHFSEQSHYFIIDKGSAAGIKQDMVALYKNCVIGKVVEVNAHFSKLLLVTDKLCKIAAHCAQSQAMGIHEGTNNSEHTVIRYISHLDHVELDDVVLSSGQGLVFPQGFALGKIKSASIDGLFYNITIEPLIDLRKLEYCCILQKNNENKGSNHYYSPYITA